MTKLKIPNLILIVILFLMTILFFPAEPGSRAQEITKDEIMKKLKEIGIKDEVYEVQFNPDDMYAFKSFSIRDDFFHFMVDKGYLIPGKTEKGVTVLIFPNGGKLSVQAKDELASKVRDDFGKAKFELKIKNAYLRLNPQDYSKIIGDNELIKAENEAEFKKAKELNDKKFRWYYHAWHLATFPPAGTIIMNLESDQYDYIEIFMTKSPSLTWYLDWDRIRRQWPIYVSKHFRIHFPEDSPLKKNINDFAIERDKAYERIVDILQIDFEDTIDLYVYNSRKQGDRLKLALNFASPEEKQVHCAIRGSYDHEITHVIAYYIGDYRTQYGPIVEGLSEYLGKPDVDSDAIAASHLKNQSIIPLGILFDKWDKQNSLLSYPQAASLVKFLIDEYGVEKFKALWTSKEKIDILLKQIYGLSLSDLERMWLERLNHVKPATLSSREKELLKSFVYRLCDILSKKDKSAIKALTSEDIGEGIAHSTAVNLEKIFNLDPVEIQGTITRTNLGSGSIVSTEVNLKIKSKKDEIKKAKVEYFFI